MALRLHRAAYRAECHLRSAIGPHRESRNEGVRRALARTDLVGVPGSSAKPWPRLCRLMPVPGTTTPEPKPMPLDWMKETITTPHRAP